MVVSRACKICWWFLLAGLPVVVQGAEIRVNSLLDSGSGSLRSAVAGAADGDTVLLRASGTLVLESPIEVNRSITITGQGGALAHTLTTNGASRIFVIAPNRSVTLARLTLESGSADGDGGAVHSAGDLVLDSVRIAGSGATGAGGAVYQSGGSLMVMRSDFTGNEAGGAGGAIAARNAVLTLAATGFTANRAGTAGGAVHTAEAALQIRNSTFSVNEALASGGGLSVAAGNVRLVNLTLAGNRAPLAAQVAVDAGAALEIGNSILAGEAGFGGIAGDGLVASLGSNLSDGPGSPWNVPSDLTGTATGLGDAGSFGGLSLTYPLEPGSPAIDGGDNALAGGTDQRGLARFSDGNADDAGNTVDIGAFEVQLYRVSSLQILGSATGGEDEPGYGNSFDPSNDADSIASADAFAQLTAAGRADIGDALGANNAAGGGAVAFDPALIPGRIPLKGRELQIRRNIAIYGPGANQLVIDGGSRSRVLRVGEGARAYISGIAIENGAAASGAGILVEAGASIDLDAVALSGNTAGVAGGGLAVNSGRASLFRSSLLLNYAGVRGGAIAAAAGAEVVLDTSTVSNNAAGSHGGAIASAGSVWLNSAALTGNTAGAAAAGLWVEPAGFAHVRNSILAHGGLTAIEAAPGAIVMSGGYNISDAQDSFLADPTDLTSTNPLIGPLALNGGTTLSHAPLPGGPAINAGDNRDAPAIDQPGFTRIRGGLIDIGPVEFQNDPPQVMCPAPAIVDCVAADGATVTLTVWVDDPDADALRVTWRLDGEVFATDYLPAGSVLPASLTQSLKLPIGDATVSVFAVDPHFSSAVCTIPVSVADRVAPVVTLNGDAVVHLECGDSYTDAGATALDTCDPAPAVFVSASNLPATGPLAEGTYAITYSATDAAGNTASATRQIVVTDTIPPVVTLIGAATIVLECGSGPWTDPGASAADTCSGPLAVSAAVSNDGVAVAAVGTGMPAVYSVVYTAVDAAGNPGTATRVVEVRDTTPPVVTAPDDLSAQTDAGFCSARLSFAATASDNCSEAPVLTYTILPGEAFPEGVEISSPHDFPPGVHVVECTATDASGNSASDTFVVTVADDFLNCVGNVSWPNALPLPLEPIEEGGNRFAQVRQFLALTDQARWYRFNVKPGSRVTVVLSELPANYDMVVYRDIAAEYQRLLNRFNSDDPREQELALLGAEFAPESFSPESFSPESFSPESFSPESFSPESFSPESFSPESFSPESFSPESFSPESFSPESFSPESFSPESFSPESFSPESFSPESFSPESFSPESFSAAQMASMVAYSAYPGVASEGVAINTFTRSGDFYVRVRGANGVFSRAAPFKVTIVVESEICDGIAGPESFGPATLEADAGDYRTIVLWDSTRTQGSAAELDELAAALQTFAVRPEVAGVVVDVALEGRVAAANAQADDLPACPYAKNMVAAEIKALIDAWRDRNPDLHYIVLLGSDDAIPFFRTTDEAMLANESNYIPPVIDSTHSQSSLRYGQVLTQDPYGSWCELNLVTGPYAYPQSPVGRLVENAAEILSQVRNYLATDGGLLPAPATALVTGYDFLDDAARAVQAEFEAALAGPVSTLIADASVAPSEGWTATDLAGILLGSRHDLVFLAGHFSTGSALAADYETRLTAAQVEQSGADFLNTVVFSAGCHSGYNTVDAHAINSITRQPDWAQAFARMGAILIAGTGYQYGDTEFIEYGERLYLEFARELRTGDGPVSLGDALNRAKRKYLAETPLMRGIHEKTLVQATLFGLPMLKVNVPGERLGVQSKGDNLAIVPAGVAGKPGLTLGLATADLSIQPQLAGRSLDLLNIKDGSTVTARWLEGRHGIVTNPAEPVRPLEVFGVSVDGTLLRGVGFRGGRYSEIPDFLPLTGAPTTEIRGVYGNFYSDVHFPIQPYSLNYLGTLCGGTDGETRLSVYPAQFLATGGGALGGTLRAYDGMDFRLYYSNNRQTYGATGVPSIPALAGPPSIAVVNSSEDGDAVRFDIRILGNPAAGIQEAWITYTGVAGSVFHGEWRPLDLVQDPADSTLWSAVLPLGGAHADELRFMVQAASGTGLVALRTNSGRYYEVGIDELAVRIPTAIELLDPPAAAAYGESVPVSARLTADGQPLAGARVSLRIGNSTSSAFTGADGIATARVLISTRPSQQLLQASFAGDREHAPSAASAQVSVSRQATALTFAALPAAPTGADVIVALSTSAGTPLKERTVFFLVDYGHTRIGNAVITDFAGRADLSELILPAGAATITAYFNGLIPVPDGDPVFINDDLYLPATASIQLTLADPAEEDSLGFSPSQADVYYKAAGKRGKAATPVYDRASIHGDLAFNVPLLPFQLLASPDAGQVQATVEARLAGQLIASATVQLDTRGNKGNHWTTAHRPGEEVSYVGIHWARAPRFDSALSASPGPRIHTTFIGNRFSEIRYVPVPGTYQTVFPDGAVLVVRSGVIDLSASTGFSGTHVVLDGEGLIFAADYGVAPGMVFTTRARPSGSLIAAVTVTEGVNYLLSGGRMIVRLAPVNGTPRPAWNATPNQFEFRVVLGSGPGETQVRSSARIGEGIDAQPWSSETQTHKQYRP